ncbi:MAG: PLP-dependent aminotransferase family protein [Chloroflexi bacterium]|nr:PLP-dependent aminotransferase family protein [Chloroflexota bacterium]
MTDTGDGFGDAAIEALLAPAVRRLPPPTSLSPLPYDLNAGVPDRATLPWEALADAARAALAEDPGAALTYGGSLGYEPLRAWIAARQTAETGLEVTSAHVTLTAGSAQGIDNIAAAFISPGDIVVAGAPTYPGAIRTFRARGGVVIDVPQDDDGMIMSALERVLETRRMTGHQAKLIYITANYDNPTGSTLPAARREALVRIARDHGVLILEDDAYTGIDLDGPPPASLFSIAQGHGIMRCGTFSKTIATGLRVGWVVAQPSIIKRLAFARFDNGGSPFLHRTILKYLESGAYDPHVAMLREMYRERRDLSAAMLVDLAEPYLTFRKSAGGFFHWLHLAPGLTAEAVTAAAARHGVAVTPGTGYYPNGGGEDRLRLVFAVLPPEELKAAIAAFAEGLAEVAAGALPSRG